jgi:hypothetical protein
VPQLREPRGKPPFVTRSREREMHTRSISKRYVGKGMSFEESFSGFQRI